ncbi:MAG: TetR/AcrR family transcriptional regulator [Caulobacter sp.]|nr:TetR/AcrR family transcriptional regulator [Caulobacter sp.]
MVRRAQFIDVTAGVLLEKGLNTATMQDFAQAAGVAKVLFYRLFPSRGALVEAVFHRVETAIVQAYDAPWEGYGSMVRRVLESARKDPTPFLVVLRNSGGAADQLEWGRRLRALFNARTRPLFNPDPAAPADADTRADLASDSLFGLFVDSMIVWLEDRDGLDDVARIRWWSQIVRTWHRASREAYRLDPQR